jgi:DNA-binding XRE family transcriptional regulator
MRRGKHITQRELASSLRVRQNTICAMEQYGIRKRSTAERYAAALGCDWKELID